MRCFIFIATDLTGNLIYDMYDYCYFTIVLLSNITVHYCTRIKNKLELMSQLPTDMMQHHQGTYQYEY